MLHGRDANAISLVMEADAIFADPQAELGRFNTLGTLDIAFAGFQVAGQSVEDWRAVA